MISRTSPPATRPAPAPIPRSWRRADYLLGWEQLSRIALAVVVATAAIAGVLWGRHRIFPALRARNSVERTAVIVLIACSTISVVTTVGIVLSLLFESLRFFAAGAGA